MDMDYYLTDDGTIFFINPECYDNLIVLLPKMKVLITQYVPGP